LNFTKFFLLLPFLLASICYSQNDSISNTLSSREKLNFPFLLDDLMVSGGLNFGGMYMTKFKDDLSYDNGFHLGLEHYQSVGKKVFLNYALLYSRKGFNHHVDDRVKFSLNTWEVLTFASYELPAFRDYDFRFLLGVNYNYFSSLGQDKEYSLAYAESGNFMYSNHNLRKHDVGLFFGLSFERNDYYFRLSSTIGHVNLMRNDQGMYHNLNLTLGYFPFRFYRQKQRIK
jgi:hypothetical protein